MELAVWLLVLAATVLVVTASADRVRVSAPLLLMLIGIIASFLPFVPEPELSPELVLIGFLPPLLYAAALRTSLIDFRANRRAIGALSVGLVVATALGIGLISWLILPIPFALAFALGAVVAPPDAVAATTIARRVGMPRRMVTVLEGESLVNDATAITCLRVALAALGGAVSVWEVTAGFLIAAIGGAAVGLGVAALAVAIRRRIHHPVFDTAVSFMVPFAAYLPAEELGWGDFHGSGVIAVVVAGLVLGHKSPVIQTAQSRVSERLNWSTVQFLLENTVFLLIGLQARWIVTDVYRSGLSLATVVGFCGAVLAGVVGIRMGWVFLARIWLFRRDPEYRGTPPPRAQTLVLGWAGLRGVVTLAAAFLLPAEAPYRELLILAAMVVVAGTLLIQGLSLPALVRRLRLRGPDPRSDALQAATVLQTASNAALAALDRIRQPSDSEETVESVRRRIRSRPEALWEKLGADGDAETPAEEYRRLRLRTIEAERDELLKVRTTGRVDHEVIEQVLTALDVEESMLTLATERADRLNEDEPLAIPEHPEGPCPDLARAPHEVAPAGSERCEDCEREGTKPVHLRICLSCGKVGCCDSSVAQHASRHFRKTHHPVMRSFERGEDWRWCYVHERVG